MTIAYYVNKVMFYSKKNVFYNLGVIQLIQILEFVWMIQLSAIMSYWFLLPAINVFKICSIMKHPKIAKNVNLAANNVLIKILALPVSM